MRLYAILDKSVVKGPVSRALDKAIGKGCDVVQLRCKSGKTRDLLGLSRTAAAIVKKAKKTFLVNDRVDIAKASGADGVHLGAGDCSVRLARRLLGRKAIIGRTAHSLREAELAQKEGADYISIGPIFGTPFKKGLRPRGIGFARRIRRKIDVPLFCVGGINSSNIKKFRDIDIDGVAMIRGVFK